VNLSRAWRTLSATMAAIAAHLMHRLSGRVAAPQIVLKVGDRAPDFTLPASDGRTYRLADLVGRGVVVVAWFPKAFTGG
jgi:peroxiredoxin Q/BCP